MELSRIISAVGRGKKLARDLTRDEAAAAMTLIMEGKASPCQVGAFLIAMRLKGETPEEVAALTSVVRDKAGKLGVGKARFMVDVPTYAGKRRGFYAAACSGFVMAAAGVSVALHGSGGVGGKAGLEEVIQAAGLVGRLSLEQATRVLARTGFVYVGLSVLSQRLDQLLGLRRELGVRTVVNTVLRLYDPASAGRHLIGITHRPYLDRLAQALAILGRERALIFRGDEGESELPLKPRLTLTEVNHGAVASVTCEIGELGLAAASRDDLSASSPQEHAARMLDVLRGLGSVAFRDVVLLNAACGMYVSGMVRSISDGVKASVQALSSGAAARKLEEVRRAWRQVE